MNIIVKVNFKGQDAVMVVEDVPDEMTHEQFVEEFMGEMMLTITDCEGNDLPSEGD